MASRSMKDLPHQKVGNGDNSGQSQNIELRAGQVCQRKTLEADNNLIYQGGLLYMEWLGELQSGRIYIGIFLRKLDFEIILTGTHV